MNLFTRLIAGAPALIAKLPDGETTSALMLIDKAFAKAQALDAASTDGAKAQAVADTLLPHLQAILPPGPVGSVLGILADLEPVLGTAVDWIEAEVAPEKVVDNQDGPVVHDDATADAAA